MYIDKGINIQDEEKIKCSRCKGTLAVKNDLGQLFLRKVTIAYISIYENVCEVKCKDCGALTEFPYLTNEVIKND